MHLFIISMYVHLCGNARVERVSIAQLHYLLSQPQALAAIICMRGPRHTHATTRSQADTCDWKVPGTHMRLHGPRHTHATARSRAHTRESTVADTHTRLRGPRHTHATANAKAHPRDCTVPGTHRLLHGPRHTNCSAVYGTCEFAR